jgi:hypothetical protein
MPSAARQRVSWRRAGVLGALLLVDLERDLGKRTFVPVAFRFAKAGPVTVNVFVSGVDHPVVAPLPTADSTG